jgi:ABC-type Fe3+-hydroxamate transport system substrate-binding protein
MRLKKIQSVFAIASLFTFVLTGCGSAPSLVTGENELIIATKETESAVMYPMTIQHAFGETIIESKPQRVAAISWGNQDVPLALGVIPVGVSQANYGVVDGSGLLPWTAAKFKELGVQDPFFFKDTDGLDYEAISDVQPDVILAAYSGITQEEYDLLSKIAPVVAYPNLPWQTFWRDQIIINAAGMGMKPEGENTVTRLKGNADSEPVYLIKGIIPSGTNTYVSIQTNNEEIRVIGPLYDGETLIIDTGKVTAKVVDTSGETLRNGLPLMQELNFPVLRKGNNTVTITPVGADFTELKIQAKSRWR